MEKHHKLQAFFRNWLIAGSAAAIARTLTAPIERIKVILQVQNMSPQFQELGIKPYKNFWDCFARLRKEQGGIRSFWRGNLASVSRYVPSVAFTFAFNDLFRSYLLDSTYDEAPLGRQMLCGALAGLATHSLIHPMAMCHTQITGDIANPRHYQGLQHCLKDNYHKHQFRGIYTGFTSAAIGVCIYRSAYFGIFETCKYYADKYHGRRLPFVVSLALAQTVIFLATLVSYPFDTVARNQQILVMSARTGQRQIGLVETVKILIATRGYSVLYRGAMINAARSICGAIIIVGYDEIQYMFFTPAAKKKSAFVTQRYHQFWRTRYPVKPHK